MDDQTRIRVDGCLVASYDVYIQMRYEWDRRKNRENQRKHDGISFELGILVFDDEYCIFVEDRVDESGEQRWHAIGAIYPAPETKAVLLVVHVYREDQNGEEIIRIISARRAGPDDVRRYQEQTVD